MVLRNIIYNHLHILEIALVLVQESFLGCYMYQYPGNWHLYKHLQFHLVIILNTRWHQGFHLVT